MIKKTALFSRHTALHAGIFAAGMILGFVLILGQAKQSIGTAFVPQDKEASLIQQAGKRVHNQSDTRSVAEMLAGIHHIKLPVQSGDNVSSLLAKAGVGGEEQVLLIEALKKEFDIRSLKAGSKYSDGDTLVVHYRNLKDKQITVQKLEIIRSSVHRIYVTRDGDTFTAHENILVPALKTIRSEGEIAKGQSFIMSAQEQGIPMNVVFAFYDIFAFDLDFQRDVYPGAKFKMMYEQKYSPTGEYLGAGDLLYGEFENNGRNLKIYRYEDEKGKVAYYNEEGKGAQKALKKTPIRNARISSRYGKRRHPILGYTKQHTGVDFAAGSGTPIPAAGDGVVVFKGWKGGYGNYIKIRHNGSYSSAYAHMKGYRRGIRVGSRVKQGQIVGYVGSTGRSTGPHLHYEILKNGHHVNPLTLRMPSIQNLTGDALKGFYAMREKTDMQFALLHDDIIKFTDLISLK